MPAPCEFCGGVLKPDIVYFGENVPRERVERAFAMVDSADALLVAGSSLTVKSGLRFVRHAAQTGKPVVIVNRGITRGDKYAAVTIDAGHERRPGQALRPPLNPFVVGAIVAPITGG